MSTIIQDQELERLIIEDRRRKGIDGPDEVWDGVYLILPNPNDEHQDLVYGIGLPLRQAI